MEAKERLLLTADKSRLVRDGDPEGVLLYCTPGTHIPESAVKLFGLVDGRLADGAAVVVQGGGDPGNDPATGAKERLPGGDKERAPDQDKEKKPDGDKGGAGGAGSGTKGAGAAADGSAVDDLTQVKFVGTVVAQGFAKAGVTTFAQIAAIDPASPPAIEGTRATTNWAGIVESAKELVGKAMKATEQGEGAASGDGAGAGAADQQAN